MDERKMRHCMAFYGNAGTTEEEWRRFLAFAGEVSFRMGRKITHCGMTTHPIHLDRSGITTLRNLDRRISRVYAENRLITGFELFGLPKDWDFAYDDDSLYICRTADQYFESLDYWDYGSIIIESRDRIDDEMLEYLRLEMPKLIYCVWGEEFMMENGRISLGYCMHQLRNNLDGHDLENFFYDNLAVTGLALVPVRRFRADGTEVRFTGTPTYGRQD